MNNHFYQIKLIISSTKCSEEQLETKIDSIADKESIKRLLIQVQREVNVNDSQSWRVTVDLIFKRYISILSQTKYESISQLENDLDGICFESIYLEYLSEMISCFKLSDEIMSFLIDKLFALLLKNINLLATKEARSKEYWEKYLGKLLGKIDIKDKFFHKVRDFVDQWSAQRVKKGMSLHEAVNWQHIITYLDDILE